ncbi:ABC transporter ATP-binding protein [Aureliella helgolandensis]|uniref:ABC transporter ATP-binding protein YtrE n=1 Tax=Aureliella helgolandensis TaxID=2527968 RepID=A0A518G0Q3_9BACT|nr:ABC transporter ATP-binding protein [Aureliella helgolandensis]QDV22094.1 ABC transporter ATP-binding protein YtrE [Aureliella helgolandensis]
MPAAAIVAQSLSKNYGGTDVVWAVKDLSLRVERGERVAIVGKSGSGKSTLLNLLAGMDHPTAGELTVAGRNLHQSTHQEMARYRLETVGVVFQAFQLIPQRTALQNVELPLLLAGIHRQQRQARAREALAQVGLSHRLTHHPYQLSGGEQQRVAIARALIHAPQLVLADEPTGNLDSATSDDIVSLLSKLCEEQGTTLLLVTHDDDVARRTCRRTIRMSDGRICPADSTPSPLQPPERTH